MLLILVKVNASECERSILHEDMVLTQEALEDARKDCENCLQPAMVNRTDLTRTGTDGDDILLLQESNDVENDRIVHVFKLCPCTFRLFRSDWRPLTVDMDGQQFSCLMYTAFISDVFRKGLIRSLLVHKLVLRQKLAKVCCVDRHTRHLQVEVNLNWPDQLAMDKAWNTRMIILIDERKELEIMMAWLSTLGGAYSALGDDYYHCAEVAGKISLKQLKIAFKLGDPITLAKCKVYFAISLLQRGCTKQAIQLIRQQYAFAMALPENLKDIRLVNMCKGVWARLQYICTVKLHSRKISSKDILVPIIKTFNNDLTLKENVTAT